MKTKTEKELERVGDALYEIVFKLDEITKILSKESWCYRAVKREKFSRIKAVLNPFWGV